MAGGVKEWDNYVNKFRELPGIVIYGIGNWGKRFFHLLQCYHIDILGFAVENVSNNQDNIEGYQVKKVKDWQAMGEKISVILALEEMYQPKVIDYLRKQGFENILPLDRQEFWLSDIEAYNCNPKIEKVCPICESKFDIFLPEGARMRFNVLCPYCDSRERHRAYWLYWKRSALFNGTKMKLLHFAPERAFWDRISNMKFVEYYPVDINPKAYGVKEKVDITDIVYEDDMFDVIICNHVLEHISDELKALSELRRVLKKGGVAFLNVPVFEKNRETLESKEYNTPELRLKYYGQSDHMRAYGRDYAGRLENAGFEVEKISANSCYSPKERGKYGLRKNEAIYICRKV